MWISIKITNRITVLKLPVSDNPVSFQNKTKKELEILVFYLF